MKRSKFIAVLLSVVFLVSFAGCSVVNKVKDSTGESAKKQTIASADGKFEITVPGNWKEDKSLNEEANLQVSNRAQEKYLIVIEESKQDFDKSFTLKDYSSLVKDNMVKNGQDMTTGGDKEITVNGDKAEYFEVTGTVEKIKAKYIVIIAQDKDNIYQIISWTLSSKFDKNKDEMMEVAQSLKTKTAQ